MTHLALGDLEICGLVDLDRFDLPLSMLLPDADLAMLQPFPWLFPDALSDGMLHLKIRSWLLRLDGRVILIDTCVGDHKARPNRPDWHRRDGSVLLHALAAQGLRPEDVDIVMCTHLHADHVGWNTKLDNGRWVPTFPNARYVCGRAEYRHWEGDHAKGGDNHGSFADSVLPVMDAGRMDLVDEGWDLARGLTLQTAAGHSPGHMCIHADHGDGAVFAGDAIHSPVQLARPDWSSAFCSNPAQARATRRALLEQIADTGRWLVPAHFADPGWLRITASGDGFAPVCETTNPQRRSAP